MIDIINCNLYVLPGLVMFTNPIVRDLVVTYTKGLINVTSCNNF